MKHEREGPLIYNPIPIYPMYGVFTYIWYKFNQM